MQFFNVAALAGLAAVVSASPLHTIRTTVDVVCTDPALKTVYKTVTVTKAAAQSPPPTVTTAVVPPPPWVTTAGGYVTSVEYHGSRSTVHVYPTGSSSHDTTVVVYEDITIISIVVINVSVTVVEDKIVTVTSTKTDTVTATPPPPPPPATTAVSTTASAAAAATHIVQVGVDGLLAYGPSHLNASIGDIVSFQFLKLNHTVTQSSFAKPCSALQGGFNTGFTHNNPQNLTTSAFITNFTVTTTAPLWFYCGQVNHCAKGMVFSINPGSEAKFDAFLAAAKATAAKPTTSVVPSTSTSTAAAPTATSTSSTVRVTIVGADDSAVQINVPLDGKPFKNVTGITQLTEAFIAGLAPKITCQAFADADGKTKVGNPITDSSTGLLATPSVTVLAISCISK